MTPPLSSPASPAVGQSWTHPQLNLTVRVVSSNDRAAVVQLCRYYREETKLSCEWSLDYDCDGLAGPWDPDCDRWLSR